MTEQPDTALYGAWLLRTSSGGWLALAADLEGCYAEGGSQEEALARLVDAVPAYYAWLSRHDEYTPTIHSQIRLEVVETAVQQPGAISAFFSADAGPVNDEDMDWSLAVLGWAYDDLLAGVAQRPASPTLDAALNLLATAQAGLIARATGASAPDLPAGDGFTRLKAARHLALARFRATSASQREMTHEEGGQRWSLRRGLRESALLARRATNDLARL
jgi:predicted RNase H-like HicB family nuclease